MIAGYEILTGTASGNYTQEIDVGDVTSGTVSDLCCGTTYYFSVAAYDSYGNESVPSNEVSAQTPCVGFAGITTGANFNNNAPITLTVTASAAGSGIERVDFYYGSTYLGTSGSSPYTFVWNGAPLGADEITAVAWGMNGVGSSAQIWVITYLTH